MNAALFALALLSGELPASSEEVSAGLLYRRGVEHRDDAKVARPHFAGAAGEYRKLWESGTRTPELAQSWARSEFLAGHLPEAIAASHAGLRIASHHSGLQRDLETYRDAVAPSPITKADEQLRQPRLSGVRARVGAWDLFWIAVVGTVLFGIGLARRFTVGSAWSTRVAVAGLLGLILCGTWAGVRAVEERDDLAFPIRVVRADEPLRKGNGESHAARIETPLPRGAEVRELARRGGWVQVRVAGGAIGWLPDEALLPVP